ncbi:hypothetical protein, partial [Streptococcus agalactiae]|uniref:hypothetical protein n=1 Tax=Streptococcus agalactiae TaxID=1311 RepID=UPI001C9911C1
DFIRIPKDKPLGGMVCLQSEVGLIISNLLLSILSIVLITSLYNLKEGPNVKSQISSSSKI